MSQINLHEIIRQQQKQLAAMQVQIQALLAAGAGEVANMEVAKPQLFDGTPSKVAEFVTGCKLYLRNKLAGATVEAQVQWILSYIQGRSADVWKENVMEELEAEEIEYESVEEFLMSLKEERQWRNSCRSLRGQQEVVDMRKGH